MGALFALLRYSAAWNQKNLRKKFVPYSVTKARNRRSFPDMKIHKSWLEAANSKAVRILYCRYSISHAGSMNMKYLWLATAPSFKDSWYPFICQCCLSFWAPHHDLIAQVPKTFRSVFESHYNRAQLLNEFGRAEERYERPWRRIGTF